MERTLPDYDGGSLVNLIASLLREFGTDCDEKPCRDGLIPDGAFSSNRVVLLICDALGALQLEKVLPLGRTPNLARMIDRCGMQRLTSVFPSTTATVLTSFHTGLRPCRHGILGYSQWIDEVQAVCEMLGFETMYEAHPRNVPLELFDIGATIHERLANAGVESRVIQPAFILNNGLAALLHKGSAAVGFRSRSEIPVLLRALLENTKTRRSLHTIYWPTIDEFGHSDGPMSPAYLSELEFLDFLIGRILAICGATKSTLILTADHGLAPLEPANRIFFSGQTRARMQCAPHGDGRVAYLRGERIDQLLGAPGQLTAAGITPGRSAAGKGQANGESEQDAAAAEPRFTLVSGPEAEAAGWYGGPCDACRSRLPDWIALANQTCHFVLDPKDSNKIRRGGHGGLTPDEMLTPLVIAPS